MPSRYIFEPDRDPLPTDAEIEEQFRAMFPPWRPAHENAAERLARRADTFTTDRDLGDER